VRDLLAGSLAPDRIDELMVELTPAMAPDSDGAASSSRERATLAAPVAPSAARASSLSEPGDGRYAIAEELGLGGLAAWCARRTAPSIAWSR